MKPEQALQLLDQAVSALQVNRDTHAKLQQAILALRAMIKPTESVEGKGEKISKSK